MPYNHPPGLNTRPSLCGRIPLAAEDPGVNLLEIAKSGRKGLGSQLHVEVYGPSSWNPKGFYLSGSLPVHLAVAVADVELEIVDTAVAVEVVETDTAIETGLDIDLIH